MLNLSSGSQMTRQFLSLGGAGVAFLYCLPLLLMPSLRLFDGVFWHDQQRLLQIILFFVVGVHLFFLVLWGRSISCWGRMSESDGYLLLFVVLLGLVSVVFSMDRFWSAVEFALFISLLQLSFQISILRDEHGGGFDRLILVVLFLICYMSIVFFFLNFIKQAAWGVGLINIPNLFHGFSNVRFLGQFQALTLPLLVIPVLWCSRPFYKRLALILCSVWWFLAIASATRGTWLGMAVASVLLCTLGVMGRRWVMAQVLCFLMGGLLYVVMLHWLPGWFGLEVLNRPEDRLHTSLMGRDVLWGAAWEMIKSSPVLGMGPMAFASLHNMYGAHPHQSFLQWAAEWGVLSAVAVAWLVGKGVVGAYKQCRWPGAVSESDLIIKVALLAAVTASATQSAVDGVLVMPVSQTWLAILAGWLWALCKPHHIPASPSLLGRWAWPCVVLLAIGVLLYVAGRDFHSLPAQVEAYVAQGHPLLHPRFWIQGWID